MNGYFHKFFFQELDKQKSFFNLFLCRARLTHQPRDVLLNAYHTNNTAVLARGSILWACCETLVWSDIIWNLFNKVCDTFVSDDGTERLRRV